MRDAKRWLEAKTEQEQKDLVRETGTRWSELHHLQHFDVARCTVIDPMHNLSLGTANRMSELWMELGILTPQALTAMEKSTAGILIQPDMDSLSNGKIAIGFASMKAAEWKSWSYDEVDDDHHMLLEFCRNCESVYGEEIITSNMHLHCHLHQTLRDFGPTYAIWLFSYERYNGFLGNFNTNQQDFIRSIAPSHSFEQNNHNRASIPWDLINELSNSTTSARLTLFHAFDIEEFIAISSQVVYARGSEPLPPNTVPKSAKPVRMSRGHYSLRVEFYNVPYQNDKDVLPFCNHLRAEAGKTVVDDWMRTFTMLKLQRHIHRGAESRSNRGSYIQALWMGNTSDQPVAYPAKILYFFEHETIGLKCIIGGLVTGL
ncbi:hypothetical protein VTP01DRAFT_10213 [Rhizomucor pusillus]|uniref:uncharacterized protein n=1 Tax=Rhizomucor pusillus TaxID=4840 RepID=UPI003742F9C8